MQLRASWQGRRCMLLCTCHGTEAVAMDSRRIARETAELRSNCMQWLCQSADGIMKEVHNAWPTGFLPHWVACKCFMQRQLVNRP